MTRNRHAGRAGTAGFSLLSASLLIGLLLAFGLVLISYMQATRNASRALETAVTGTQLAEAGVEKALFCMNSTNGAKCGGTYGINYVGETNVDIGTGRFTTTVTGSGTGRHIRATGTVPGGRTKVVETDVTTIPPTDNTTFSYAMQTGDGGAHLENNAQISGTLYADGNVDCQSDQAKVDGDLYVAKTGGMILSCTVNYDAHADKILTSKVLRNAFYQSDITGTTVTGTKYPGSPTPVVENLPAVDLTFWHDSAEAGGTYFGNYVAADNSHLGPLKITGDLSLGNNIDVVLDGPVWVMGNVYMENGSSLTLAPTWGAYSTAVLADDPNDNVNHGKITIINGASISGSGNPKSHIMLISTNSSLNDTAPALSVANNASGAVFLAVNGTMRLQSNAGAKSLAAKRLFVDQNAVITYVESELADMNFSNSPGGIWRLKEGSWFEAR